MQRPSQQGFRKMQHSNEYREAEQYYETMRRERLQKAVAYWQNIERLDPIERREVRRSKYACGDRYVQLGAVPTWDVYAQSLKPPTVETPAENAGTKVEEPRRSFWDRKPSVGDKLRAVDLVQRFPYDATLLPKLSLHKGDITTLEVDAIVNAANYSLLGGGGIDGAIHDAAGGLLLEECRGLNGCETGDTKATKAYFLPSEYVLHTVGPIERGDEEMRSCYQTILKLVESSHSDAPPPPFTAPIRSIAFCCVGTGIFGFPRTRATHIALHTIRLWLERHHALVDRIVFVVFGQVDLDVYEALLPSYFPLNESQGVTATEAEMFPFTSYSGTLESKAGENVDVGRSV